jgi:hypothetical protein
VSSGINLTVIFELVLAGLLVATIVYAAILDRKLGAIRQFRTEMEGLIKDFADSTLKAEQGLAELRAHAGTTGAALQQEVEGAVKVLDDLKFLVERGELLSNHLESASAQARDNLSGARGAAGKGNPCGAKHNTNNLLQVKADANQVRKKPVGDSGHGGKQSGSDAPISERLDLSSKNPGASALLKALQRMR